MARVFAVLAASASLLFGLRAASAKEHRLLVPTARLEKVVGDLSFSEGPAWRADGEYLLFEDIPKNRIMKLDRDGKVSVFREPSGRANGLFFDPQGRLIAAEGATEGGGRRVSRTEKDGSVTTLADRFEGKRLNSPNDVVVDKAGRIYFTDPRYGDAQDVELETMGVYRIDPDRKKITRITDMISRPNGIALSGDGKTLFVSDAADPSKHARQLVAFDLRGDGSVTNRRVLFEFAGQRGIDGMTVDVEGRIWATAGARAEAGIHVFALDEARKEARLLTVIGMPEEPTNCAFGGPKRDMLYITTKTSLFRIQTATAGLPGYPGK